MPFPAVGWPPRPASGRRSIRFFKKSTATAAFADNAWLFIDAIGANTIAPLPYVRPGSTAPVSVGNLLVPGSPMGGRRIPEDVAPPAHENSPATQQAAQYPQIWSGSIRICNLGALGEDIEISFDGTNVHGYIPGGMQSASGPLYFNRFEAGISVRGVGAATPDFTVEAW